MGAQITALTHFSQRYPKVFLLHQKYPISLTQLIQIPKFAEHGNVFFAFDFSVLHPGWSSRFSLFHFAVAHFIHFVTLAVFHLTFRAASAPAASWSFGAAVFV
jgi:hypothetical protein